VSLAIFDLDNTLLSGDSDYEWGRFLVQQGIVDNKEYKAGRLDIHGFLKYALKPLADNPMPKLNEWHRQFMSSHVQQMITPAARRLVEKHRENGDTLLIITATNRFVTAPIAREFGIENLLATEPEIVDGRFTGKVDGTPCFQQGKVERLHKWLEQSGNSLRGSWFYTDSHNDLPLMHEVEHPVAVNPDTRLLAEAEKRGWPIISTQ
jgi:HAD superfamily hydrolase (TIGR01490 family)